MKRRNKRKPLAARLVEKRERRARREEALIERAAEPVPPGSGLTEYGEGKHCYVKTNVVDGSMRCFRFRTQAAMRRAMATGMAADTPHSSWNPGVC